MCPWGEGLGEAGIPGEGEVREPGGRDGPRVTSLGIGITENGERQPAGPGAGSRTHGDSVFT